MSQPLVSIICLCYNHERFVREALCSALEQSYKNIELIIVDDASTDNSAAIIEPIARENPQITFLKLARNIGNCRAFNRGLAQARGEFIIDFATDDVMLPDKIEKQVKYFSKLDQRFGVVFTDAVYIDAEGKILRRHFDYLFRKKLIDHIPEGDVYQEVLSTYFIASPTMMVRRAVFDALNGYDEDLSYEDFDFWVRSSRIYQYACLKEPLIKIRRNTNSMSSGWYAVGDPQLHSTYLICKKAQGLNRSKDDRIAYLKRIRYELRQSVFSGNHPEAKLFYALLKSEKAVRLHDAVIFIMDSLHLPLPWFRNLYHQYKYQPLR